jgi:zinc transporter ZupT
MAAGVSSVMRYLGGVVGIAVLGDLLHLSHGRAVVLQSHHTVLVVFAGALVVGLGCAVLLPRAGRADADRPE